MKIRVLTVGRPKLGYAKDGVAEYSRRLSRMCRLDLEYLRSGERDVESHELLACSDGSIRVALDERGVMLTTLELTNRIRRWQNSATRSVAFLVGGADGHTPQLRESSELVLAMSAFTLQHELALLVLLEQLYRVYTILAGAPYHRDS